MRIIHFALDTPMTETADGFSVDATALGLVEKGMCTVADQILVNGYTFSHLGVDTPRYLVYQRDSDKRTLIIHLK